MSSTFIKEISTRRTIYGLSKANFPLKNDQVVKLTEQVIANIPSSFNNQTNRAVVLFGKHHEKLWSETVYNAVKAVTPAEDFEASAQKLTAFAAAYGTVLFYQDTNITRAFEEKFPIYAPNFVPWTEQTSGAAQIALWTALALENVGANLQHYSELVKDELRAEYNIPEGWVLSAQLVFGSKVGEPLQKTTLSSSETTQVFE